MKKIQIRYIAFWAVILFFAACTERMIDPIPQVSESSRSYIFFEPEVIKPAATKAGLITGTTLVTPLDQTPSFGVIGYCGSVSLFSKYANGIAKVTYSSGAYNYSKLAYWQDGTTLHDFYAFYPYSLHDSVNHNVTTQGVKPYVEYAQPTSYDAMVDLLTVKTSTAKADNVDLQFEHRLWALDVKVVNKQTKGLLSDGTTTDSPTMKVTGVKVIVEQFPTSAYIYLDKGQGTSLVTDDNGAVVLSSAPLTYTLPVLLPDEAIAKNASKTCGSLLFLPVPSNMFKYKLEIAYLDSRNQPGTFTTPLQTSSVNFEGGKKYVLSIHKTNDTFVYGTYDDPDGPTSADGTTGGRFAIGDWNDATKVEHQFN